MKDYYDEPTDLPTLKDWCFAVIATVVLLVIALITTEYFT